MEGGGEGMWGKERMGREESIDRSRYGMCGEGRPADIGVEGGFEIGYVGQKGSRVDVEDVCDADRGRIRYRGVGVWGCGSR